jgi:hypothetical protein
LARVSLRHRRTVDVVRSLENDTRFFGIPAGIRVAVPTTVTVLEPLLPFGSVSLSNHLHPRQSNVFFSSETGDKDEAPPPPPPNMVRARFLHRRRLYDDDLYLCAVS